MLLFPPAYPTISLKLQPHASDWDTHGLLYSTFTCQSEETPPASEIIYITIRTEHRQWWAELFVYLFVCLGRLCFIPPLHLYLSPWQHSSRDTQLSSNLLPQPASQQTAVEEPLSLICLSSADRELPLGAAAVTSQAAWETAWWRHRSVLLSFSLIPPTDRLNAKSL